MIAAEVAPEAVATMGVPEDESAAADPGPAALRGPDAGEQQLAQQ